MSEIPLGTLVWADLGEKIMWPARLEVRDEKFWVFCQCDCAMLSTKNIQIFDKCEVESWKAKAEVALKKKPRTLKMWLQDMEWAKTGGINEPEVDPCGCTEVQDGCNETEVVTGGGDETEIVSSITEDETKVIPVGGDETEVAPLGGDEAEVIPVGDETKVAPGDGDKTEVSPCDGGGDEAVIPVGGDETEVAQHGGDEAEVIPVGDETKVAPGDGDKTEVSPCDCGGDEAVIPVVHDESEVTPCGGDEAEVIPVGDESKVDPADDDKTEVSAFDGDGGEAVIPVGGDETEVAQHGGDEAEVVSIGDETKVALGDGDETEVSPCDCGSGEAVIPVGCDETEVAPGDGGEAAIPVSGVEIEVNPCPGNEAEVMPGSGDKTYAAPGDEVWVAQGVNEEVSPASNETEDISGDGSENGVFQGDEVELFTDDTSNYMSESTFGVANHADSDSEYDDSVADSDYSPPSSPGSDESNSDGELRVPISVIVSDATPTPKSFKDEPMETNQPEQSEPMETNQLEQLENNQPQHSEPMETNQPDNQAAQAEDGLVETQASKCCHEAIHDALVDKDEANPGIYVRKQLKSRHTLTGRVKATDRVYNNYHCCFFCKKLSTNIKKHFLCHKDNSETQEIVKLKEEIGSGKGNKDLRKKLQTKQTLLRHKGDHFHNMQVKKEKKGELIIARKKGKFILEEYGPCPKCLEWLKMESYKTKHQTICPGVKTGCDQNMKKGEAIVSSAVITGDVNETASARLIKEVYPIMTRDSVTTLAMDDSLIVALGNNWLRRNLGNTLKRKYYTSSRMRGAARLLQHLRDLSKTTYTMSDFLSPKYFDLVCEAALLCARMENDDEEDLTSPSAALKIGFDVSRMSSFKLGLALRRGNKEVKVEAEEFNTIMKMDWSTNVSRIAHVQLRKCQMEKSNESSLPVPEDLSTLSGNVIEELKNFDYEADIETYRRAVMLTQTRLLTYNKRRSGELEALTVNNYKRRSVGLDEADSGLLGSDLTDLEKYLCQSQEVIKIRGKNGKIVPVIVPEDAKKPLEYIACADVRRQVGVRQWNPYLFANTGDSVIRSYESMKTLCSELSLKAPERITSVSLRKYIATLSQVIDMKEHELEWLCQHLGHTANIHKLHYRATSGFIERVNIGKLMLLQDLNLAGKYAGKRLQDIDITEVLQTREETQKETKAQAMNPGQALADNDVLDQDFLDEEDEVSNKRQMNSCVTRKMWTAEEEEEVTKLFSNNFKTKKSPGMKECMNAIRKSREGNGRIYHRNWETIKKKVLRMMKK